MVMMIKGMEKECKGRKDYGHFEPNVGWNQAVSDVIFVSEMIKEEQTCPLFLLGHSMGNIFYQDVLYKLKVNDTNAIRYFRNWWKSRAFRSIGQKAATIETELREKKNEKSDAELLIFRKLQLTL